VPRNFFISVWMMIMFDFPVVTAKKRKAAADFREAMLSAISNHPTGHKPCSYKDLRPIGD